MIDGWKDSDYIGIPSMIYALNSKTPKPGELRSKRLPVLRNVITVQSEQPGCFYMGTDNGSCG